MSSEEKIREILEDYSLFLELPEGIPQRESQRELPDINDAVDRLTDLMAEARREELAQLEVFVFGGRKVVRPIELEDYIKDRTATLRSKEETT